MSRLANSNCLLSFATISWMIFGYVGRFPNVIFQVVERQFFDVRAVGFRNVRLPLLSFFRAVEIRMR